MAIAKPSNPKTAKTADESLEEFMRVQAERTRKLKAEIDADTARELKEQEEETERNARRERKVAAVTLEMQRYKAQIKFSEVISDKICRRISNGEMLSEITDDVTMPPRDIVIGWLDDPRYLEFSRAYEKACNNRGALFADQLITIADDSRNDYVDRLNSKTGEKFRVIDQEALGRSKMRLDMRMRHLKAFFPERWGDNPDTAAALRDAAAIKTPSIVVNYITAAPLPGDAAKVIDHQPGVTVTLDQKSNKELITIGATKVA